MAQHTVLSDLAAAYATGEATVDDPGAGGTFVLGSKSGCICLLSGDGTRTLPNRPAGWQFFITSEAECDLVDASGRSVASLLPGGSVELRAYSATRWTPVGGSGSFPFVTPESLGCVSLYDDSTFDSTDYLQAYFDALGVTEFRALYIPGKSYGVRAGVLTVGKRVGASIICNGQTEPRGELDFMFPTLPSAIGGSPSRLVSLGGSGPILTDNGVGLNVVGTLNLQGATASTRAALLADCTNYADEGYHLNSNPGDGLGRGKTTIQGISAICCKWGFVFGDDAAEDNADNVIAQFMTAWYCGGLLEGGGIKIVSDNSAAHVISHLKYHGVPTNATNYTGVEAVKGGAMDIRSVVWLPGIGRWLRTYLNSINVAHFNVGTLHFDNGADDTLIWECDTGSGSEVFLNIDCLKLGNSLTPTKKRFLMMAPARLHIRSAVGMCDHCVDARGYNYLAEDYKNHVIIENSRFRDGESQAAMLHASSVGTNYVYLEHNSDDKGNRYDKIDQIWTNAALATNGTLTYDVTAS